MLAGETKIRQQGDAECEHNERELPYEQASQITGTARLGHGAFSGQLYNGSDWTITRVVINISAKEDDETIRWSRDFSETLTVNPLTTESFSVAVAGDRGIQNAPWQIKHVFGCKE